MPLNARAKDAVPMSDNPSSSNSTASPRPALTAGSTVEMALKVGVMGGAGEGVADEYLQRAYD